MKIVMMDSSLGSSPLKGHPEHFLDGLSQTLKPKGAEIYALSHKSDLSATASACNRIPTFSKSMHDMIARDPFDGKLEAFQVGSNQFAADLNNVKQLIVDADIFFMPTAVPRELSGLARWLSTSRLNARVGAIFHWAGSSEYGQGSLDAALLRQATREMNRSMPIATWFAATQPALARAISGPLGRTVEEMPSLTFFPAKANKRPVSSKWRIGLMGGTRREKGAGQIRQLVSLFEDRRDIEFVVQCHGMSSESDLYKFLERQNNTITNSEWLDEGSMVELCRSLDLAILPYDRWFYRQSVSGIFTLLAGLGIPAVVPSSTWMSDRIEADETAGITYDGSAPTDIAAAVDKAIANLQLLAAACRLKSASWCESYSASRFVNQMVDALFPKSSMAVPNRDN